MATDKALLRLVKKQTGRDEHEQRSDAHGHFTYLHILPLSPFLVPIVLRLMALCNTYTKDIDQTQTQTTNEHSPSLSLQRRHLPCTDHLKAASASSASLVAISSDARRQQMLSLFCNLICDVFNLHGTSGDLQKQCCYHWGGAPVVAILWTED